MSGSGRNSQYRKSVTDSFLSDDYIPGDKEEVVRVLGNRGDNTFEVLFESQERALAKLPKKFNKLIWIKTGDFVVIEKDETDAASLIDTNEHYSIVHILSKPNIKFLKGRGTWPSVLEDGSEDGPGKSDLGGRSAVRRQDDLMPDYVGEEEEEYEEDEDDVLVDKMGNTISRK